MSTLSQINAETSYPSCFRPLATNDLVRVGAHFDGGYVLPARLLASSEGLLSFGLCDQWEFEAAFFEARGKPVVCFDHTVDAYFWVKKAIVNIARAIVRLNPSRLRRAFRFVDYKRFFDGKRGIHVRRPLGYLGSGAVDVAEALKISGLSRSVLLKMDIEGWEYRALGDIVAHRDQFSGIAIEFHDVDLHEERIVAFIGDIAQDFVLVHFHANSHTTVGPGGKSIVIEMTFMSRQLLSPDEVLSHRPLPIAGLDAPNLPGQLEATVVFAPPIA